jgi:hypothetical protein
MRRCRRRALQVERHLIEVAVPPVLPGFVRPDEPMVSGLEVRGGVSTRRVVATTDVPADLAEPQVHPIVKALCQTVLASVGAREGWGEIFG